MDAKEVRYLVFDVESAIDGQLVSDVRYSDEQLDAAAALDKYRMWIGRLAQKRYIRRLRSLVSHQGFTL